MSEERSGAGGSGGYISGGPLLVGLIVGAGLGTLICKLGGLNYACLMKKISKLFCGSCCAKKKCPAATAAAALVAPVVVAPVETRPPTGGGDDAAKKPCKTKKD